VTVSPDGKWVAFVLKGQLKKMPITGGAATTLAPRTITHAMCEAFSGPVKNYHTDAEMARALGFPDIVVQGMMSVCFVADALTKRFGVGFLAGQSSTWLVNVVWPGDAITVALPFTKPLPEGRRRDGRRLVWQRTAPSP
jgi:hypothetical protein